MASNLTVTQFLDKKFSGVAPSTVLLGAVGATIALQQLVKLLKDGELTKRANGAAWRAIRTIADPLIINKEIATACQDIHFPTAGPNEMFFDEIPETGLSEEAVMKLSTALHERMDGRMDQNLLSGVVYWGTRNCQSLCTRIIDQHLWSNAIFADYFGSARKMEAEVANMMLRLFNGEPSTMAATYALGGTESILLCMLAYRNEGHARGIAHPEIIMCQNAHPAFDKAGFYFGLRIVKVPCNPKTTAIDLSELRKNINASTIGIVGSAPNFATGVVDPIAALSAIAIEHNLLLHVDACLGGFVIQFMERAGFDQPTIDFRVPGVSSITCDIHKWGGTPKGASVALFRSKELRKRHVFVCSDFPGGLYVTGPLLGSRPGYVAAAAWATILHSGMKHYTECCRAVVAATRAFAKAVVAIDGGVFRLMGSPDVSTVAFTSDSIDIYEFLKAMKEKGYQFNALQFPPGLHLGLTMEHTDPSVMRNMCDAMAEVAQAILAAQGGPLRCVKHKAMMYGSSQAIPDRTIVDDVLRGYTDLYYTNRKSH